MGRNSRQLVQQHGSFYDHIVLLKLRGFEHHLRWFEDHLRWQNVGLDGGYQGLVKSVCAELDEV